MPSAVIHSKRSYPAMLLAEQQIKKAFWLANIDC